MTTDSLEQKNKVDSPISTWIIIIGVSLLLGAIKILVSAATSGQQINTDWLINQADSAYGMVFYTILLIIFCAMIIYTNHFIFTGKFISNSRGEPFNAGEFVFVMIVGTIALLLFDLKLSPIIFGDGKAHMFFNTQSEVDSAMKLSKIYNQIYPVLLSMNLSERVSRSGAVIIQVIGYIASVEGCIAFYERLIKKKNSKEV